MLKNLLRKKSLQSIQQEYNTGDLLGNPGGMHKVLGVKDLTFMGVAAVIGAGIFSTIGQAAFDGGPGVIFLFIITAVTCGFTALCYAEFASRVPVSGSAYTYSYVAFGELIAWIIGWALILEYAIGNIVVAISWSAYFNNLLEGLHIHLPAWLVTDYTTAKETFKTAVQSHQATESLAWVTAPILGGCRIILNIPAFIIVVLITMLVYIGIQESKKSANLMVILKIVVLLFIIGLGIFYIDPGNWKPFLPNGFSGVLKGVSAVFYAYIGFDAISSTAEECKNPQRDLPRSMMYSLLICTIIYVATTLVITGMVHYSAFNNVSDPLAFVFEKINQPIVGYIVSFSAVVAATSVILVFQIGQPRIWMSMSRDGLLPKSFGKIHPKYKTPAFATIITGIVVGVPALLVPSGIVTDLTSIGTLFAFVLVCGGVLLLPRIVKQKGKFSLPYINGRYIMPLFLVLFMYGFINRISNAIQNINHEAHQEILFLAFVLLAISITILTIVRKFSLIPVLGMLCCMYLMIEIPVDSWIVFFIWMAVGLAIYFLYSKRKSKLAGL